MKKIALVSWGLMAILLFIGMVQVALAGVVVEQLMRDREGVASKVVLYFSGERMRTDDEEGRLTTILDFRAGRMMMIDHRSKNYIDIKYSQWKKEVTEQLRKEFPYVKTKKRKVDVRKTGETAIIDGFRTEKIQVWLDGGLVEEDWVTKDVDMAEVDKMMAKVVKEFSKDFRSGIPEGREIYEKLQPHGFPILVIDYTLAYGLGPINVLEVKKLEKRELEDEIFLPPKDYQQIIPAPSKK